MTPIKKYQLTNKKMLLRDKAGVDWHVKQNDYFGTLATIVNLINQDHILNNKTETKKILRSLSKDLSYLQKKFIIVPKPSTEKKVD